MLSLFLTKMFARILPLITLAFSAASSTQAQSVNWVPLGGSPKTSGQTENVEPNNEVVGAVNALAVHPKNADILYVGAVNGGIWMTENATAPTPSWQAVTDGHESLSIGAIEFDPTDTTHKTLVAGSGGNSSFGASGSRIGILRTTNGLDWTGHDGMGMLAGLDISGVVPRGDVIVISAARSESSSKPGLWRSTDKGSTWTRLSDSAQAGLPDGHSFEVCGDPRQNEVMYAHTVKGLFKSSDLGATWTAVGDTTLNSLMANSGNVEIAVGMHNNVYVATVGFGGELTNVYRSGDGGATWAPLGVPTTVEGGIHPGAQGSLHLSLAAEPSDENIVYIGGDRQAAFSFPNSIGANDWSGRLFRGNAALAPAQRWAHLTHSNELGNSLGGTANSSAPHADSRAMAVAANGVLIEGDDGGVYRRTSPKDNTGDWFSANGDLQTGEYHAIAWDAVANVIVAGAQDTGSSEQVLSNNKPYRSISTADGGVVAVDDRTTPGRSVRFSSNQRLGSFRRRVCDANNTVLSTAFVPLTPLGSPNVSAQFYTPIALNSVKPTRMILGAGNGVFESTTRGDTVRLIGPGITANGSGQDPIAYGAADNEDALYVGAFSTVFVRDAAHPDPLTASPTYPGGMVMCIVMDPNHWETAYVIDPARVFATSDGGNTWTDLTGNLSALNPRTLRCLALVPSTPPVLMLGSDKGVYARVASNVGAWTRLSTGLPKVAVYHLEYDATDHLLIAGTLGRGAWTIEPPSAGTVPEALAQAVVAAAPPAPAPVAAVAADDAGGDKRAIRFAEGIVVDAASGAVVLMRPVDESKRGAVESVQINSGQTNWQSTKAEKPIDVNRGRVIAQARPEDRNDLKLSVLDGKTGEEAKTQTRTLAAAHTAIDATIVGKFTPLAKPAGDNELIFWQFDARVAQGVRPGALPTVPQPNDAPAVLNAPPTRIGATSGTLQFNLESGELQPLNVEAPAATMSDQPAAEVNLQGVEGEQVLTADSGHVAASVAIGDDTVFEKYRVTIHNKETGEKVGEFRSHIALPKVYVAGERILVLLDPYTEIVEGNEVNVPRTLRAYSTDGEEAWKREVRDIEFRGPYPP
jgi:hypothetical protein